MAQPQEEFKLSAVLSGHGYAVRDVAAANDDLIATLEERGQVVVWKRSASNLFQRQDVFAAPVHQGLAFCLEYIKPSDEPEGIFASGGNDKVARFWTAAGEKKGILAGHNHCVNSISTSAKGEVLTGSWDGSARVWHQGGLVRQHGGHEHAVEVLGLPTGEIVTGSTNKSIVIFDDRRVVRKIPQAHDHAIRKLVLHPLGFASCGNDGFIKVWSNSGDQLLSIAAHTNPSSPKFVYGLTLLSTGELVSCGEDGHVKVWNSDGTLLQSIQHPGPVRSVTSLANGDFVTACTDRSARVFTRTNERIAADKDLAEFDELARMVAASAGMQELDTSSLPDQSALLQPGKKNGEIKVVNLPGKGAWVFKWDAIKLEWEPIGEAIGKGNKTALDGKTYDHVTEVWVSETRKVKLGFNRDDDPIDVATAFCALHGLPPYMRNQIVDHVSPLVDPAAIAARKREEARQQAAGAFKHVPSWNTGSFHLFGGVKVSAMHKRIMKDNAALLAQQDPLALNEAECQAFELVARNLSDVAKYHANPFSYAEGNVMKKLLQWPSSHNLAGLDAFRALMCHAAATQRLAGDVQVQASVLQAVRAGNHVHMSLVLKALTNWVAKRPREASESQKPPVLAQNTEQFMIEALDTVASAVKSDNQGVREAYVMLCYNIVLFLGRIGVENSDLYLRVASSLCEVLSSPQKNKVQFYALLTLGSLGQASMSAQAVVKQFMAQVDGFVQQGQASQAAAVREVAADVAKVYSAVA